MRKMKRKYLKTLSIVIFGVGTDSHIVMLALQCVGWLGRDDFQFFWNFITAFQILPCVIETRRYGYIRDSGGRFETPH